MNLIENMMESFSVMDKVRTPDGEGGFNTTWKESATIMAAITLDSTMQSRIAEAQGVTSVYTVTTSRNVLLEFHDVLKRQSDGEIFRVTSNASDKKSPNYGTLDIAQVTAERWKLT